MQICIMHYRVKILYIALSSSASEFSRNATRMRYWKLQLASAAVEVIVRVGCCD